MRKYEQVKIMNSLSSLDEALDELHRQSENDIKVNLLADCQELAVQIGNYIESIKGVGTETVALLEEYCELLFKASRGDIGENDLRKFLVKICSSARSELAPNKIEIAFLSYNASMSDSIFSIYKAANADSACSAYWIPIPYFERNSEGLPDKICYEGQGYYPNIQCTDWNAYNIEERHPDIIFTYNPYDNNNYVTSVHPNFYCERLRGMTDLLVYVPYFVVTDDVEEHFTLTAGCMYAHKVILQSKKVRDTYIRTFKGRFKDSFGKPKDKFVALGSPKYDEVVNASREDWILPDEWHEKIGSNKIILYNTSIGALLNGNEQYLIKLRRVIDTFSCRGDVAIWFRPHPLIAATYKSMRPRLHNEYEELINKIRGSNNIIYDDSPDLHRAISWSDTYYGDWSSVVALYQATGKPIMIQNIDVTENTFARDVMVFEECYDDGEFIWFESYFVNALFRAEKTTWACEYMGSFLGENINCRQLFSSVARYGDKLYFAPLVAKDIGVYDMVSCEFSSIKLPEVANKQGYSKLAKFGRVKEHKGSLYFIPASYPAVVKLDVESSNLTFIDSWHDELVGLQQQPGTWLFYDYEIVKDEIYLPHLESEKILILSLSTNAYRVVNLNMGNCGYTCICSSGDYLWICARRFESSEKYTIVRYDTITNEADSKEFGYKSMDFVTSPFIGIFVLNDFLWGVPHYYPNSIKFNVNDNDWAVVDAFKSENECEEPPFMYSTYSTSWTYGNTIYALGARSRHIISFDTVSGERQEQVLRPINEDNIRKLAIKVHRKDINECNTINEYIYGDSNWFDVDVFVDMLMDDVQKEQSRDCIIEQSKATNINMGDAGEKIYGYVKKLAIS